MRKLFTTVAISAALVVAASTAWANCHFETYFINGKAVSCTVCYYGNNKTVSCI